MTTIIDAVLVGKVRPFGRETSAIVKAHVAGARSITALGVAGDAQADLSVHGGIDKAVHHYPRDHYRFWQEHLGALPVLDAPGAFGENISTIGLTEDAVCIGDRFRLGTALVEVAQGRQPCWKQAHRLDDAGAIATMVRTRRCGWYYRVIEHGQIAAGDTMTLQHRAHPDWTVERVIAVLIGGDARRDPGAAADLAKLDVLADNWRARALALSSN